uniref:Uncharacterized protein n=1 Tax=Anguilla anguilla TaxID=7936 RepID=A0A0E9TMJ7_ANGAN
MKTNGLFVLEQMDHYKWNSHLVPL